MRQLRAARRGFTLVELLVVIAIIAILVALSGAAYFYWMGSQQKRNTDNTMRAVNKVFQSHWNYVVEEAKKETPSPAIVLMANNDMPRARVLWIKIRLMEAFPITYAEVNGNGKPLPLQDPVFLLLGNYITPNPRKYLGTYSKALNGSFAANNAATESGACLLTALSVSRAGSTLTPDDLGKAVEDTDADGIKELVDGWDSTLSFYRFAWSGGAVPTAPINFNIQSLNPAAKGSRSATMADPLDPNGALLSWPPAAPPVGAPPNGLPLPWNPKVYGTTRGMYEALFHKIAFAQGATPSQSVASYVIPVVVSSGLDRQLGMNTPPQCATSGFAPTGAAANDNLFSFNLKGY